MWKEIMNACHVFGPDQVFHLDHNAQRKPPQKRRNVLKMATAVCD